MKLLPALLLAFAVAFPGGSWAAKPVSAGEAVAATKAQATSLHELVLRGDVDGLRRLIQSGADLNRKDAFGSTPLIIAATFGRSEAAAVLIGAKADLRAPNRDGSTPLHIAALFGRTDIVRMLLDGGAPRDARNAARRTPYDMAAARFEDMRATYARLEAGLAPLGLRLDPARLAAARAAIAEMLRPSPQDLRNVRYAPIERSDWVVSTPEEEDLDPRLVAELYFNAARVETLYGLLVVKHGHLVAEGYFNDAGVEQLSGRQSATKSVVSAMVGIALAEGCLSSVEQKMIDFFPELADRITDPRKRDITIRQLLEMRAGYPWEGRRPPYFEKLFMHGDWRWLPHIEDFPLVADPGAAFGYSNLSSHLLSIIVQRACHSDLQSLSQAKLFAPLGARVARWTRSPEGYNWGWGEIYLSARDMAKFGLLYLHGGRLGGQQIVPADWVGRSLQPYSLGINIDGLSGSAAGLYFRDIGYGYQWWSGRAGAHRFDFAWGHGGQLIVLLPEQDMVIVTTADPLHHLPNDEGWPKEVQLLDLVGRFVNALPGSGPLARQ